MMFSQKTIWLIGASEGIGEAVAEQLAQQGATLILSSRNGEMLTALAARLSGSGHLVVPLDVTNMASIENAWQNILSKQKMPDTMIYNAGYYEPIGARRYNLDQIEQIIDVNLRGALRVLSLVLPAFIARDSGHVVLVGSVAGYSGLPKSLGYGSSKAGVIHLAESLKLDLVRTAIKVQLVSPGFVKTRLTDKNNFAMPFLMLVDAAARRIVTGMASKRFEIHFPRRFSLILKLLRLLPYPLYFRLIRRISG